jgi:NADP-dependent 3-hydroxy acid dehydrogenase YdfG
MGQLGGVVALITGGGSGLGRATSPAPCCGWRLTSRAT